MRGDPARRRREKAPPKITDVQLRGMIAASSLNATQRATLAMAADALYRDTLQIKASYHRIAGLCGVGRRQAINRMQSLEATGVLVKERWGGGRFENGQGRFNVWRLDLKALCPHISETTANPQCKGEPETTSKGEIEQHQGCKPDVPRVNHAAHDPRTPTSPKKDSNTAPAGSRAPHAAEPAEAGEGTQAPSHVLRLDLRPWFNTYDPPAQTRAHRITQLRRAAAVVNSKPTSGTPTDHVPSHTEGGT